MQFDTVEAGSNGVVRPAYEVVDDAGHLRGLQCTCRSGIGVAAAAIGQVHERGVLRRAGDRARTRADRLPTLRLQRGMRHAAYMPELGEDRALRGMHRLGDELPPSHLLGRPDARHVDVTLALRRDRRALADDQAGAGALPVVLRGERVGDRAGIAGAGHRRHRDAVAQGGACQVEGMEQGGGHVGHLGTGERRQRRDVHRMELTSGRIKRFDLPSCGTICPQCGVR